MSKVIFVILAIAIFYIGFIFYSDFNDFAKSIIKFKLEYLLPIFGLFLAATLVKGFRQQLLFKTIGISIPIKKSILLHYAGYSLTLTPGGSGEFIKTYYLKKRFGYSVSKSFPVFITERFYDLLGITTIIVFSLFFVKIIEIAIIIFFIIVLIAIIYITINSKIFFRFISKISTRIPLLKKYVSTIDESQDLFQDLTKKNIVQNLSLSIFSFLIYAIAFYFVFLGFDVNLDIIFTTFVTFTSILFGYLSFLPGGVGVTEISLVGFLTNEGIALSLATSIMIMLRLTGWWFLTIIGVITTKLFLK